MNHIDVRTPNPISNSLIHVIPTHDFFPINAHKKQVLLKVHEACCKLAKDPWQWVNIISKSLLAVFFSIDHFA